MIAGWLLFFAWCAISGKSGWVPLAICGAIVFAKGIPFVPSIILLVVTMFSVALYRWRLTETTLKESESWKRKSSIVSLLVVSLAWAYLAIEWRWIEQCNHDVQFDPKRPVVCIGDSLTSGMIPEPGYPGALKNMLSVPVINNGQSGIATEIGLERMPAVLAENPQVVVIELGGHDFLKGYKRSEAKQNLLKMIAMCRAKNCEVLLAEIPRGFMFDPFLALEREIAYEQDVPLVHDGMIRQLVIWSPVCPPGMWFPKSRLSDDGIHSNSLGSQAMARRVEKVIVQMVGNEIRK